MTQRRTPPRAIPAGSGSGAAEDRLATMLPLRLSPGADLRSALVAVARERDWPAAFVLGGIGSLSQARLRLAGCRDFTELAGDLELLTLAGTLSPDGPHLHASVADATGRVIGGHVGPACLVRTTAEILVIEASGWRFHRAPDPATGYDELVIRPRDR